MQIVPVTITEAKAFVGKYHRHNRPPVSALFALGLGNGDGELIGVAIGGRPVARSLQDGRTIEITRVCSLGHKNANSKLYGHALRPFWNMHTWALYDVQQCLLRIVRRSKRVPTAGQSAATSAGE